MRYLATRFIALLCLFLFLVACGGSSNPISTPTPKPNPSDKTAPTLSSSLPVNGATAVPINAKLGFSFSESIDEVSLELSSSPAISLGSASWNSERTRLSFANKALRASALYTLTLKASDLSGNPLEASLTFSTSDLADTTAPSTPAGLVATPGNAQIALTWQANTEADLLGYTLYMGLSQDALESKGLVTGNSKTITGLSNGTTYFFALDAVDSAGNASAETAAVSATPATTLTDTIPPTLQSSDPADGATDVDPRNPVIKLVFTEPMDVASLNLVLMTPDPCNPLAACLTTTATPAFKVMWSETDTIATATLEPPDERLLDRIRYTLKISANDKAGNALLGETATEISFTTAILEPYLVSSTPADGATNVPATATDLTFTFSEPLNPTYFVLGIHPPFPCAVREFGADQTTFTIRGCELKGSRSYRLSFADITQSGKSLSADVSFSTVADGTPPRVLETSPAGGTENVPLATQLRIVFDNTMDEASTLAAVSSSAPLGCTWTFNQEKDTLTCSPSNLANNTSYTVTVLSSAKDIAGNQLALPPKTLCFFVITPCGYIFTFSTPSVPTTGGLRVNISGAPTGLAEVTVTGPNNYYLGDIDSSRTLTDLNPGSYTITAQGFSTGQPNKPTCKLYIPLPATQTVSVTANATATSSVTYEVESCAPLDDF